MPRIYDISDLHSAAELLAEQGYMTWAGAVSEAACVLEELDAAAQMPDENADPANINNVYARGEEVER